MLTFDASGNSRGVATIIFKKAGLANEAQAKLDGVKVDDRAMKVQSLRFSAYDQQVTFSRLKLFWILRSQLPVKP